MEDSEDGDIIYCVPITRQPAFDHPLLKNHTIQLRPRFIPEGDSTSSREEAKATQVWHNSGEYCPENTVPIRKTKKEDILRRKSIGSFGKKTQQSSPGDHEYAIMSTRKGNFYGTEFVMNIWRPEVEVSNEFSLAQTWLASGDGSNLNTIEAGLQVYPGKYGDNNIRLFVYWTRDGYRRTGCYNNDCSGFVQTSNKITVGGSYTQVSQYDGAQYGLPILIWKDSGNWWLKIGEELVGYWPGSLFTSLGDRGSLVNWGGEIVNQMTNGRHTATGMGSGRFAEEWFKKASYFRKLMTVDESNTLRDAQGAYPYATNGNCYSIKAGDGSSYWGIYFFYGGPDVSEKILKALPVETPFKFPSPLPTLPQGGGFARRAIDLGGLEVSQVSTFNKVWSTYEGGPDNLGATFFEPSSIPSGFSILGYYAQPNNRRLFGWVLTARDLSSSNALKPPVDYTLVGTTESLKIKQDGPGYFWHPVSPDGYQAVGLIVTNSSQKPPLDKLRCVRSDLTEQCEAETWLWGSNGVNVSSLRPTTRGTQATGVCVGTFAWQTQDSSPPSLSCLKNAKLDFSTMPNESQIEALFKNYSPCIYFHPDEEYLPSSVNWYFTNGALLYKRGQESNPVPIESNGSNLPQGGSNDGSYWLDLPVDKNGKERVKKGDLQSAKVYLHIKPMLGATFTDIAIWVFYPFNGPARAKVKFLNLPLGKIGEHVGDWEHATLRVSNFNGELWRMFLSQHSGGVWVDACDLEFQGGGGGGSNKPVAYASLHGHAMYPKPGLVLQGDDGVGIRNDTAKGKKVIDTGLGYEVIAAEYVDGDGGGVAEPPWVNYLRKWGPKIDYNVDDDVKRIERILPGPLKKAFVNFARKIPDEVYGEDGPTGPKLKGNWAGDEK
ncbi:unnamed protein product [Thlaspi arvense]|uniref:Neprosin PEP catalytic domain-containing protein n=1 Tax=Thlaspi arvense TaxID=13288 RepID=A0AAU9S8U7_THLAR|nr:unnamed protein product [Thlaspi arvense]